MFTTFGISTPDSTASTQKNASSTQQRPKRAQVARACDWCRLTRVKCDSFRPCRNCSQAGRTCGNNGRDDFRSVAAATREVQRLRAQIQELEAKLLGSSTQSKSGDVKTLVKPSRWKGIKVKDVYYGPSALTYFAHRLSAFIDTAVDVEAPANNYPSPVSETSPTLDRLQRHQQDSFFDLFWQGYHVVYPIVNEALFRRHYNSLWESASFRRSSALVDIVLALSIHSLTSYVSVDDRNPSGADRPGYDYYTRAQYLLSQEAESPTLMTVQTQFFSVVYLRAIGQFNSAYTALGNVIRMAQSIGLDPVAGEHLADGEDEMRQWELKSLWDCLQALDTQLSLHLGRPLSSYANTKASHEAPSDSFAQLLGPNYTNPQTKGINWLTFHHELSRLYQLVSEIQKEFATVCDGVLEEFNVSDFYGNPSSREKCAVFLLHQMKKLKSWAQEVPEGLKISRKQGSPMSVDRSPLELSHGDPLWLQRQRLSLELEYHTCCIAFRRSFISFLPTPALGTLSSDNHCIACTNHAVTVTNILHQILQDTDILTGWYQVIDWQRTAMFALAGFASGYPICPPTPPTRKALVVSATVFEMCGATDMVALAKRLDREATRKIRDFTERMGITPPRPKNEARNKSEEPPSLATFDTSELVPELGEELFDPVAFEDIDPNLWAEDGTTTSLLWGGLLKDLDQGLAVPSSGDEIESLMVDGD